MNKQEHQVLEPGAPFAGAMGLSWQVLCPKCTDRQPNIDRIGSDGEYGPDERAVIVHPDRDEYSSPLGTRGGWVEIQLTCGFHNFSLVVANHKGEEYIGIM